LEVKKGSLTAMVGDVGCGKSSLIGALLGEMRVVNGDGANIQGKVTYVPQTAWVQNATVEDNILCSEHMKEELYQEVKKVTALDADIKGLPGGDQCEI